MDPEKKIPKNQPKRSSKSPFYTIPMTMEYYNMNRAAVMRLAQEAGALIRFDRTFRVDIKTCDAYFVKNYTV